MLIQQSDDRNTSKMLYISKLIRSKYAKKPLNIKYCNDDKKNSEKLLGLL